MPGVGIASNTVDTEWLQREDLYIMRILRIREGVTTTTSVPRSYDTYSYVCLFFQTGRVFQHLVTNAIDTPEYRFNENKPK